MTTKDRVRRSISRKILNDPKTLKAMRKTFKLMKIDRGKKIERSQSRVVSHSMQIEESERHIVDCKHEAADLVRSALDDGANFVTVRPTYGEDKKKGRFEINFSTGIA